MPVTIPNGSKHMNVITYTGNGTARTITGVGFQPDFVWIKNRTSGAFWHQLYDVNRGALKSLFSNDTSAESTYTDTLTAFTSDGFTLGTDATFNGGVNKSGDSYVAWCWKANGTAVTNTAGSISAQVSANTTAGFSIVTYTGTGANATVGHGLGAAPRMVIAKNRTSGVPGWPVYHASVGNTGALVLNSTSTPDTSSAYWNNTTPTSSVFSVGTGTSVNTSSQNYVAYCFAQVAGYSRFGSYTGNGSADGTFVYLGFRPAFVLTKCSSTTGNWMITDDARNPSNLADLILMPNNADQEYSQDGIDMLSNGFKMRASTANRNTNGATYIYMAFAENPFKYANAR